MIQIAVLGFGTVGAGVGRVLAENAAAVSRRTGEEVFLKSILDPRPLKEPEWAEKQVSDFSVIENDPEITIVVETIGGVDAALDFTRRALKKGKHVVTSNKELVAQHGQELLALAKERGVRYLFEASVGGGIPILHPLRQCLCANELTQVTGILNGTTNYILTRMIRAGVSFEEALGEAQQKGYAERDPSADIEGRDACRKICILASLCFGRHLLPHQVPTVGITGVTEQDVACGKAAGCRVKLLGRAVKGEDGRVCAFVEPHFVPEADPLSGVEDVFNAISVTGNAIGDVMFYGRGAGAMPTASAVVSDVMELARGGDTGPALCWNEGGDDWVASPAAFATPWCVRVKGELAPPRDWRSLAWDEPGESVLVTPPLTADALHANLGTVRILAAYRILSPQA